MSPKIRFNKENIIEIAFEHVRQNGWEGLSARYIADRLSSSTGPIYTQFKSMKGLEEDVVKMALDLFYTYITEPVTGDKWVDHGIGYLRFAKEEKHLFNAINEEKYLWLQSKHASWIWEALGESLADYPPFQGMTEELKLGIRVARFHFIHGLASLIANGAYSTIGNGAYSHELDIETTVRDTSHALLKGFCSLARDAPEKLS